MAITNATRLSDFAAGIGTEGAILQIDNANQRIGIGTQLPSQMLEVAGIVTATAFHGDGSNLEGITSAGLGTAIDETEGSVGAVVYYTDDLLTVAETTTINPPASASAAYTQYRDVKLEDSVDLIIETGDDFIPDVLGLGTDASDPTLSGNGVFDEVYAGVIKNKNGLGAPAFANGLTSVGVITATGGFSGNVTGNVTGYVTGTASNASGATGDFSIADKIIHIGDTNTALRFPSADTITAETGGSERLRIGAAGQIGIAGANFGTSGQVLTSQGASAAPSWTTPSGGSWELVSTTYCPDLGGTEDNVDFVGLSTAYSAYKVQFTGCTFSHRDTGARSQDKVLGILRNMSGAWVTTTNSYRHRNLRVAGSAAAYTVSDAFMQLTSNEYVEVFDGELIIPMATNNVSGSYGTKNFYGHFISDAETNIFGCNLTDNDIRTTGFDGIRLQSDDNKWREGRISLYRLKHT